MRIIQRHKTLSCVIVVISLAVVFMGDSLLPDRTMLALDIVMWQRPWRVTQFGIQQPYNSLPSDPPLYLHPIKMLAARGWRQGIPLWEPHILSGYPIIGNAQAGIFYPGILPYLFLPGADAFDWTMFFHLILAGLGMLSYLRALKCHHIAALFGAIVFMLNTSFVAWLAWDSVAGAWVWLPWALSAFEWALRPGCRYVAMPGAFSVALIYLGGHLQWSLYAMLILVLYSGLRLISPGEANRRQVISVAAILGLGGTALAAIQLLPTLEYINAGNRGALPFDAISRASGWSGFLMMWVPGFYGTGYLPPDWWGPINYNESMIYVGIAPLILAIVGVIRRHDRLTGFYAVLGIFGALCAAGTAVYGLLYWLPGFNSLSPIRMRYLVIFSLVVLGALGLDWLLRNRSHGRLGSSILIAFTTLGVGVVYVIARGAFLPSDLARQTLVSQQEVRFAGLLVLSALVLIMGLLSNHWGTAALIGVVLLTGIDLLTVGRPYYQSISTDYYYPVTDSIRMMQNDSERFRILTTRSEWSDWALRPNLPALFGLDDVGGYDSIYLQRYAAYLRRIDQTGPAASGSNFLAASHFDSPLVNLLNVKYAITPDRPKLANWELIDKAGMRLYLNKTPMPRAWVANRAEVIAQGEAILDRLSQPAFDPYQTVIVEQPAMPSFNSEGSEPAGEVHFEQYTNNRLVLAANMQTAGWLVLSEVYYPGWHVMVDSVPADLYRANFIFRAVPLTAGKHRIEMWFMPDSFVIGATISIVTAAILFILGVGLWHRERRRIHLSTKQEIHL